MELQQLSTVIGGIFFPFLFGRPRGIFDSFLRFVFKRIEAFGAAMNRVLNNATVVLSETNTNQKEIQKLTRDMQSESNSD